MLNYDSNGRITFNNIYSFDKIKYSCVSFNYFTKKWDNVRGYIFIENNNTNASNIYFKLNDKSFIRPSWNEFTNTYLNYEKNIYSSRSNFHYSKEDIEYNLDLYKRLMDIEFLGYIPIEEFEYYLLAN